MIRASSVSTPRSCIARAPGFDKWWERGTAITTSEELRTPCILRAEQSPEMAEPWMLLGLVQHRLGDSAEVLRCVVQATEIDPGASLSVRSALLSSFLTDAEEH